MIEIVCNDRLGKKIRVKCNADDTVGDLKKLIAAHIGLSHTRHSNASPCLPPRLLTISFPPFAASSSPVCRHKAGEDPPPKVVHCLQGPHNLGRLRDTRLDEPRDVLQLSAPPAAIVVVAAGLSYRKREWKQRLARLVDDNDAPTSHWRATAPLWSGGNKHDRFVA
jgi:hypothetical protein